MLVNFPLWLWLTFRAWSASGSSLSTLCQSADSWVPFPLAVPAQQREIALSRSQDQILAASGSRRMEVIRSDLAAVIRNDTSL